VTRKQNFFGQLVAAADVVVLFAMFLLAYWVRAKLWRLGYPLLRMPRLRTAEWILTLVFPAWLIAFRYFSLYNPVSYRSASGVISTTIKAHLLASVLMLNALFILRGFGGASRPFLALMIGFSSVGLVAEKLAVALLMRYQWRLRRQSNVWRVLLVGSRTDAENYLEMVREHPEWNLEVVDVISTSRDDAAVRGVSGNLYPTLEQ
jgi:FlaA1/EpsC-like NDP-sugar epimerase